MDAAAVATVPKSLTVANGAGCPSNNTPTRPRTFAAPPPAYTCTFMGLKATLSRPLARYIARRYARWQHRPETTQRELLAKLTATAAGTAFGRTHDLGGVK